MLYDPHGTARAKDDRSIVEFFVDAKEDKAASAKEGRPIYRDVEMVRIRFPADRARTLVRPAHAEWTKINGQIVTYAQRFPEEYKRFKAGQAPVVHGMPLKEAPFLTEAQRRMLLALDVYTVEQLAGLEGQPLRNLGPNGRDMVEKAKAFLATARGSADMTRLASENEVLRRQVEALQQTVAELAASQPAPADKPGTPFDAMTDDQLKAAIKEATGQTPRGNPSRETLIRMATEVCTEVHEAA